MQEVALFVSRCRFDKHRALRQPIEEVLQRPLPMGLSGSGFVLPEWLLHGCVWRGRHQRCPKVLEHYLPRLLKRIREAFPDYIIVLRADSGFNSNALIETCLKLGSQYIMGFPPIKAAQQAIYSKGLKYAKRKQATRYMAAGTAPQIIGAMD